MKDYFVLAFRNLKHRGIRSWLTLLGILIGVMAVVALVSLGSGLEDAVGAQFGISSTEVITVQAGGLTSGAPGTGVSNRLTQSDVDAISKLSTVEIAIGRNIEDFKLKFNGIVVYGYGFGRNEGEAGKWDVEMQGIEAESGRLLQDGDRGKVLLGYNYMNGDDNGFGKDIEVGDKVEINDEDFRVVGFMEKKGSYIIDNAAAIPVADLDELADNGDFVDVISVKVKDSDLMDEAAEEIEDLLRDRRDCEVGKEDFEVSTPEAAMESINSVLSGINIFVIIIASISIFVGCVGIVNTMTTSVLERRKDIGVMKAVGARNSDVFWQFFIESGLLGFFGGLIGVLLGTGVGFFGIWLINYYIGAEVALSVDYVFVGLVLLGSFFVGSVAGIVPALSAANQNPVEALRG